jgi:serine/threonine protein kinase
VSNYPSMDQYNDVVQHPTTAFTDPVLKASKIAVNGMGLPIALGGGFALTYSADSHGRKYAVRCFHKEAKGLDKHYAAVEAAIKQISSPYFIGFEYQANGVLVNGSRYPIVRMDWVEGETLGNYLEDNYSDKLRMEQLRSQFAALERYLTSLNISHGDLQNGNVLVTNGLKLIDYDGMYVPSLPTGQGSELGHKHFQHPKRTSASFGPSMDRFSFIVIDLSLRALIHNPGLFKKYSSGENIILTANDFLDPGKSPAIAEIRSIAHLATSADNFAKICRAEVSKTPSLEDFNNGKNIPNALALVEAPVSAQSSGPASYVGAFEVVDAQSFSDVERQVGNKVELVGQVVKVTLSKTRYGRPYCFVFFNSSRQSVRLNIWSDGLKKLPSTPDQSWVGKWLSVQGLIDPPYDSKYGTSLSVTISTSNQLRTISSQEAAHRLRAPKSGTETPYRQVDNQSIMAAIGGSATKAAAAKNTPSPSQSTSRNQSILATITPAQSGPQPTRPSPINRASSPKMTPSAAPPPVKKGGFPYVLIAVGLVILFALLKSLAKG